MVMDNSSGRLTAAEFRQVGGEDWRPLDFGASAWFAAPSHQAGAALVSRIAELTGDGNQPDVDLRVSGVRVRVGAAGSPGLTDADVALASTISAAALDLGLAADPAALQTVHLAIDALDRDAVAQFWSAVLGYPRTGDELVDPLRRIPTVSFHAMDSPRPLRNRFHFDISVPNADLLAGVTRATGVPADPEGNELCLPTGDADRIGNGPELADWRAMFGAMVFYPTTSFRQAADLAEAVAGLADEIGKPLLVDLRPDGVTIDSGKDQQEDEKFDLDEGFAELARRVQSAARRLGLVADAGGLRFIQIAIDAVDIPVVRAFWLAVLGYRQDPRHFVADIYDPRRLNPVFWFQQMDASEKDRRAQRNRTHVDLFVPHDQARTRIDEALAAGGRIVYEGPEWWTLADPEGNEIDIIATNITPGD